MRQQLVPHPVPGHAPIVVRRILPERDPPVGEIAAQLDTADRQQRPNQETGPRPHPGQPGRARPADEPEQHRFRLVVDGVAQRHPIGAQLPGRPAEERVTHLMPRLLDGNPPRPRHIGHGHRFDQAGHAEPTREVPAEALVPVGLRPAKPVIHMRESGQRHDRARRQLRQDMQQRHRVTAARHGGHDPPPAWDQRLPLERRRYTVGE